MDSAAHQAQRAFLEQISPDCHFHPLFDHLAGVSFFAKDADGRIMCANHSFVERLGLHDPVSVVGKTDHDLFPRPLADKFRADDVRVMESGEPMVHMVELFLNRQGIPDWFVTNKLPLRNRAGAIIGVTGTVQRFDRKRRLTHAYPEIERAVAYIQEHFRERISIRDLARRVGLSLRQFDRKFKETFKITPQNFIVKTRIQAACDALREHGTTISEVAVALGFYDQSAFTAQFRSHMGITPLKYQKQFRLTSSARAQRRAQIEKS